MSNNGDSDLKVDLTLITNGQVRISHGNGKRGKFVIRPYREVRAYVLGHKPRADLIKKYDLAD